jgi:membrane protein DedA with SNARE-associated domain
MTHSVFELMRTTVLHYGYWAVAAFLLIENIGVPVPGETILLLASFLAYSEHELKLPWIIVIATVVTSVGGSLGFALGFHGGRPLLDRYLSAFRIRPTAVVRGENLFARFGALTIFFARFIFGLRLIAGPLAGVLRMPWRKFLIWNFLGAAAWVSVICGAGYLFGRHWGRLERDISRADTILLIAALVAAALWRWGIRNRQASAK